MTAKQIAGIAESMEKLGYKIIKITDREGDYVFPAEIEIKLAPGRHGKFENRFGFNKPVRI
jgi:dissimilatory sulfite reductase (desulfoviridin) alpha/beta subunit